MAPPCLHARLLLLVMACGCSESTTELIAATGAALDASAAPDAALRTRAGGCGGPDDPCACNNGIDDDDDGEIDGLDAECTGPYDDDESTFATGAPAAFDAECLDCFWDDDSSSANDGCEYHRDCRRGEVPQGPSNLACFSCEVTQACVDSCKSATPNGCDCFGCCEITRKDGSQVSVLLQDGCSVRDVDDPSACPRCIPNAVCRNECGTCELCLGKKRRDLPALCRGMGADAVDNDCDEGEQVCDERRPCPVGYWCQLGCCLRIPQ